MGLMGPAKSSQRPVSATPKVKSGGAGNMPWYHPELTAAASSSSRPRPASATMNASRMATQGFARAPSGGGAAYAAQSALAATQTARAAAFAASPTLPFPSPDAAARRPPSASAPPPLQAAHEDDCICTICTCGRHNCPPTPRVTHYDANLRSEARAAYAGVFQPAQRVRPNDKWVPHDAPFEGLTTHAADFVNHGRLPPRQAANRSGLMDTGVGRGNGAPFDDTTTHKADFPAHPVVRRAPVAPMGGNLSTAGPDERDWATEGRSAFVPHPLQARRAAPAESVRPSLPFHGTSTAKADFVPYPNARPSVAKYRSGGLVAAPEDRQFGTESRSQFTHKAVPPCPAAPISQIAKLPGQSGHVAVERVGGTQNYRRKF